MFDNIEGRRFERLVAVRRDGQKWLCRCDCGGEKHVFPTNLKRGLTKSCGCLNRELSSERLKTVRRSQPIIHAMSRTPEHNTWVEMRKRCAAEAKEKHPYHAGRGIAVCERWNSFENFYADMGKRPTGSYSIDRIDNDGDYEPGNCRWATPKEQANNRRPRTRAA